MNVRELIQILESMDPDAEVRLATQPNWPFEAQLGNVVEVEVGEDDLPIVYIGEGEQEGYLPGNVKSELGW